MSCLAENAQISRKMRMIWKNISYKSYMISSWNWNENNCKWVPLFLIIDSCSWQSVFKTLQIPAFCTIVSTIETRALWAFLCFQNSQFRAINFKFKLIKVRCVVADTTQLHLRHLFVSFLFFQWAFPMKQDILYRYTYPICLFIVFSYSVCSNTCCISILTYFNILCIIYVYEYFLSYKS